MALFKELRKLMYAEDVDQKELAVHLGRGQSYMSTRMTGKMPFDMGDVYAIIEFFADTDSSIELEEIAKYFPRDGKFQKKSPAGCFQHKKGD